MTHSPRMGGHGGRGHQVSRKTVQQRRRSGVQPRRGHNFDHRLRNAERLEDTARIAKAYQPFDAEAVISALTTSDSPVIREDVRQELWVLALQGASEAELRAACRDVRTAARRMEFGDLGVLRLDQPLHDRHGREVGALIDLMGEDRSLPFDQAPLSPDLVPSPDWRADVRDEARAIRDEIVRLQRQARRRSVGQRRRRRREAVARSLERRRSQDRRRAARDAAKTHQRLVRSFYVRVNADANRQTKKYDAEAWAALPFMSMRLRHPLKRDRYTPPETVAKVQEYAEKRYSLRLIASMTGLSRNTVTSIAGPRADFDPAMIQPSTVLRCERCGYSPSSHVPSSKARRAGNTNVCARPVAKCPRCDGWRSTYSTVMCADCRIEIADRRRRAAEIVLAPT